MGPNMNIEGAGQVTKPGDFFEEELENTVLINKLLDDDTVNHMATSGNCCAEPSPQKQQYIDGGDDEDLEEAELKQHVQETPCAPRKCVDGYRDDDEDDIDDLEDEELKQQIPSATRPRAQATQTVPRALSKVSLFDDHVFTWALVNSVVRYAPSLKAARLALDTLKKLTLLAGSRSARLAIGGDVLVHAGSLQYMRLLGVVLVELRENRNVLQMQVLVDCRGIPPRQVLFKVVGLIDALIKELPSLEGSLLSKKDATMELFESALDTIVAHAPRDAALAAPEHLYRRTKEVLTREDKYRRFILGSKRVQNHLLPREGCLEFLRLLGFVLNDETYGEMWCLENCVPEDMLIKVESLLSQRILKM